MSARLLFFLGCFQFFSGFAATKDSSILIVDFSWGVQNNDLHPLKLTLQSVENISIQHTEKIQKYQHTCIIKCPAEMYRCKILLGDSVYKDTLLNLEKPAKYRMDVGKTISWTKQGLQQIPQTGDTAEIWLKSMGCFHFTYTRLCFVFDSFSCQYYYEDLSDDTTVLVKKGNVDKMEIWNQIRAFEKGLYQVFDNGCTTIDDYVLIYNNYILHVEDGSCKWDLYHRLFSPYFPKY